MQELGYFLFIVPFVITANPLTKGKIPIFNHINPPKIAGFFLNYPVSQIQVASRVRSPGAVAQTRCLPFDRLRANGAI